MAIANNGTYGYCAAENNVLTFQVGGESITDAFSSLTAPSLYEHTEHLVQVADYRVLTRGHNNRSVTEIASNVKSNRLLPEVIEKQVKIMYGLGLHAYRPTFDDNGKLVRKWEDCPEITTWLRSWNRYGLTDDANDVVQECIRRYYYFEDFFVKWRFLKGKSIGRLPVAGFELVENSRARLATKKPLTSLNDCAYDDFTHVMVGNWRYSGNFEVYPRFDLRKALTYDVAISHHANDDVDSIYGRNKAYDGSKEWLLAANENPRFIRSFLRNAMAAKVHVVIPIEWVNAKESEIKSLCDRNLALQREGKELIKFNGIDIGTQYDKSLLIKYTNIELQRLTNYLSGADNQGKMFSSFSFRNQKGEEVKWKIEQVDLKYKEYIESLITFDRRADEVLISAKGIDPSISNVSKEGIISKSGSDAYYNYLIYMEQLPAAEKICCDPFNMALMVNFPHLWEKGYMIGLYRNIPARQQDVSTNNRLTSSSNE